MNTSGARVMPVDDKDGMLRLVSGLRTPKDLDDLSSQNYDKGLMELIDRKLIVFSLRWGRVFGFQQEQEGRIVQNLFPIQNNENDQISSSSKAPLELHTETAFHPYKPDKVVLFCMKGDKNAGTVIAELPRFIDYLDRQTKDVLKQRIFNTSLDASFQNSQQHDVQIKTSILSDDETSITFDKNLMTSDLDEGQQALSKLVEAIEQTKRTIVLEAGDVLVIDNHTTIHGRTSFEPRYDGSDRWIKRLMVNHRGFGSCPTRFGWLQFPVVTYSF